jgi:hypothetical protein
MALVTFTYELEQWTLPEVYKNIRYRVDIYFDCTSRLVFCVMIFCVGNLMPDIGIHNII